MPTGVVPETPGVMAANDNVQITASGDLLGQAVLNVWYATFPTGAVLNGTEVTDELKLLCQAMGTYYVDNILPLLSEKFHLDQIIAKKIGGMVLISAGPPAIGKWILQDQNLKEYDENGALTGDELPSYVAVTMNLASADSGRHWRGGKRFAGLLEAATDGNILTDTPFGLWQALGDGLLTDWDDAVTAAGCTREWKLTIASNTYTDPTGPAPPYYYYSLVVAGKAARILGSQVSRKQKRRFA